MTGSERQMGTLKVHSLISLNHHGFIFFVLTLAEFVAFAKIRIPEVSANPAVPLGGSFVFFSTWFWFKAQNMSNQLVNQVAN